MLSKNTLTIGASRPSDRCRPPRRRTLAVRFQEMDDPYIIIGLVGSLASVAGLAISAPTAKSRFVHAIYGFVISVVAGGAVLYGQSMERQLEEARRAAEASKSEIARLS